jgi:predicted transcriptional regulator
VTKVYARNFACLDCGAPVGRRNCRCPRCGQARKAALNREYQKRYHAEHRPTPKPLPQRDPELPPYGEIVVDAERIQCHVCGRWYGSLVTHIRTHGLDAERYKAEFGLARGASLWGPATIAKQRAAALARDQASHGTTFVENGVTRPRGIDNRLQSRVRSSAGHREPAQD